MKKRVDELKVSSGVDTLYYFCDVELTNYIEKYNKMQEKIKEQLGGEDISFNPETGEISIKKKIIKDKPYIKVGNLTYLGKGQGFTWFSYSDKNCKIARIGFKKYSLTDKVKNIWVQLDGSSIYYNGLHNTIEMVTKELNEFGTPPIEKFVSRIDLNIFSNISFAELDIEWVASKFRKGGEIFTILNGKKYETIYFGKKR